MPGGRRDARAHPRPHRPVAPRSPEGGGGAPGVRGHHAAPRGSSQVRAALWGRGSVAGGAVSCLRRPILETGRTRKAEAGRDLRPGGCFFSFLFFPFFFYVLLWRFSFPPPSEARSSGSSGRWVPFHGRCGAVRGRAGGWGGGRHGDSSRPACGTRAHRCTPTHTGAHAGTQACTHTHTHRCTLPPCTRGIAPTRGSGQCMGTPPPHTHSPAAPPGPSCPPPRCTPLRSR